MILQTETQTALELYGYPILFAALGALFGAFKFFKGYDPRDGSFRPRQFIKTVIIWGVAGIVASQAEGSFNQAAVAGAVGSVAPIVNAVWDTYLTPAIGGSPTHGSGEDTYAGNG